MPNISGLLTFDKIMETLLAELMIMDINPSMDPKQYGKNTVCPFNTVYRVFQKE